MKEVYFKPTVRAEQIPCTPETFKELIAARPLLVVEETENLYRVMDVVGGMWTAFKSQVI